MKNDILVFNNKRLKTIVLQALHRKQTKFLGPMENACHFCLFLDCFDERVRIESDVSVAPLRHNATRSQEKKEALSVCQTFKYTYCFSNRSLLSSVEFVHPFL